MLTQQPKGDTTRTQRAKALLTRLASTQGKRLVIDLDAADFATLQKLQSTGYAPTQVAVVRRALNRVAQPTGPLCPGRGIADEQAAQLMQKAALAWWESARPVGWTQAQHAANPTVNQAQPGDTALALAIGAIVLASPE